MKMEADGVLSNHLLAKFEIINGFESLLSCL